MDQTEIAHQQKRKINPAVLINLHRSYISRSGCSLWKYNYTPQTLILNDTKQKIIHALSVYLRVNAVRIFHIFQFDCSREAIFLTRGREGLKLA